MFKDFFVGKSDYADALLLISLPSGSSSPPTPLLHGEGGRLRRREVDDFSKDMLRMFKDFFVGKSDYADA